MKASITITGDLGSGKSTIAKELAKRLNLTYYSTGQAQRKIAQQMGITTLELNKLAEKDTSIDDKIDSVIRQMNNSHELYVVDSRLAWFFMPNSYKIKLSVDKQEAARRIFNDTIRTEEKKYQTLEDALQATIARRKSERERFLKYYQVDIEDESQFDLIIDTTHSTIEEICDKICAKYQEKE